MANYYIKKLNRLAIEAQIETETAKDRMSRQFKTNCKTAQEYISSVISRWENTIAQAVAEAADAGVKLQCVGGVWKAVL